MRKVSIFVIAAVLVLNVVPGYIFAGQTNLRPQAIENGDNETLLKDYAPGIGNFNLGSEPSKGVADTLSSQASTLTGVVLDDLGMRGKALGVTNKKDVSEIKNTSDGTAKRVYTEIANRMGKILLVRVSEGIGRDEVAESFDSNDVVVPDALIGQIEQIRTAIAAGGASYASKSGQVYEIVDAIIDVIEGTNAFVTNAGNKPFNKLSPSESGATSIIATGEGVRSTGNCPDIYADSIITTVPFGAKKDFINNPLDPELTANDPSKVGDVLSRIATANGITLNDIEVLLMDRAREGARLAALTELKKNFPGLEIVQIKDGTVAHGIEATLGRKEGKHKVFMTVGGSPEAFFNNAVTGIFKDLGAVSSFRLYSKNVNMASNGKEATDLKTRYAFDITEQNQVNKLRPNDAKDILEGKKLFTQEDVVGGVEASVAFITHNGVFGTKSIEKLADGSYKISVLRFATVDGKPSRWIEERVVPREEVNALLVNEVDTVVANLEEKTPLINAQTAITSLIQNRDSDYMKAVNSTNSAASVTVPEGFEFMPGRDAFEALMKSGQAMIAVNVVSYNQIEGHIRAAIKQNAVLIFEVAKSQLGYALDENTVMSYVREIVKKTGSTVPIIVHGDHIQYSEVKQMDVLKKTYEEVNGEGSFKAGMDVNKIDAAILRKVNDRLKEAIEKERKAITAINERLIKAGFTSIAIDASTIFDEFGGEVVSNYYANKGTKAEKLAIKLENEFALPLEWGVDFLKLDPDTKEGKARFDEVKNKIVSDMQRRNRPQDEIDSRVTELQDAFGKLVKEAKANKLDAQVVIDAYDKVMIEIEQAKIAGIIEKQVFNSLTENQKRLLLPSSNVQETAYQLGEIQRLLGRYAKKLVGRIGIEVEVGHVDRKFPNPRRGGKMEAKMTHPAAVKIMGDYLTSKGLYFNTIATNNGSGHGTEFDKATLTPVSQVGKISPYLTLELQREANKFGAAIAQHGTSGSDMDELAELSKIGEVKFNIATNYQQIELNVLSLLDDGLQGEELMNKVIADADALMGGLHANTRAKIMRVAGQFKDGTLTTSEAYADSLFMKFMKKTYAWGLKKGKIKESSTKEDIATVLAKEFKRVFGETDKELYELGRYVQDSINMLDAMAYNVSPEQYKEFYNLAKESKGGALVIEASAISKTTGMLELIKQAKRDFANLKVVVYMETKDKFEAYKLRLMGVGEVVDVISQESLETLVPSLAADKSIDLTKINFIVSEDGNYGKGFLNRYDFRKLGINPSVVAFGDDLTSTPATGKLAKIQKARKELAQKI